MTVKNAFACRKPAVMLFCDDPEELAGVSELILAQICDFRVLPSHQALSAINELQPPVVLFALSNVSRSVKLYTMALKKQLFQYHHVSILLASNKESETAFKLCIKGLFEDYFIYRPLYERFRLNLLIHNAVKLVNQNNENDKIVENFNIDLDRKFEEIVDQAKAYKQNLNPKIAQYKAQVSHQRLESSDTIKLQNMLDSLESELRVDVDKLIDTLLTQKMNELKLPSNNVPQTIDSLTTSGNADEEPDTAITELQPAPEVPSEANPVAACEANEEQKHVLVVEDNSIYRELLVNILENDGLYVDQADNGKSALIKIEREEYDLVLMDLFMPRLNGLKATRQIQEVKTSPPPVIAITGNKNKDVIKSWVQAGLRGYIVKPSTRDEILSKVHQIID